MSMGAGGFRRGFWHGRLGVITGIVVLALVAATAVWVIRRPGDEPPVAAPPTEAPTATCSLSALLVPTCGALFGAAANPVGDESWDQALTTFEKTVRRTVDIAHYYNSSPEVFPTPEMIERAREPGKRRILMLNWKPEMGRTWAQVAAGDPEVDAAIDAEARYLKANFTEKFFLVIHHEPEEEVDPAPASGMTAVDYKAMYRHVALRLRQGGVTNAVYVMNYAGSPSWGSQPWFKDLYPGDDVVDWIAEDPYIFGDPPYWGSFAAAVDRKDPLYPKWPGFYTWAVKTHPGKPIMLGEFGIDEQHKDSLTKAGLLLGVRTGLGHFPQLKALVYWNESQFPTVGDTRLDSSATSKQAARQAFNAAPLKRQLG